MAEKNELIGMNANQKDPYRVSGSDWPDGKTSAGVGTGQGSGATHDSPNGGGKNMLVSDTENQCAPRHVEDDGAGEHGAGTPVPGNRGARVSANFRVETNKGEGDSRPSQSAVAESIDLASGKIVGPEVVAKVESVADHNVHVPSR